jgi:hypothetical protein
LRETCRRHFRCIEIVASKMDLHQCRQDRRLARRERGCAIEVGRALYIGSRLRQSVGPSEQLAARAEETRIVGIRDGCPIQHLLGGRGIIARERNGRPRDLRTSSAVAGSLP